MSSSSKRMHLEEAATTADAVAKGNGTLANEFTPKDFENYKKLIVGEADKIRKLAHGKGKVAELAKQAVGPNLPPAGNEREQFAREQDTYEKFQKLYAESLRAGAKSRHEQMQKRREKALAEREKEQKINEKPELNRCTSPVFKRPHERR